jgi:glycosyltransferase involved in cell wall biosynthesis
MNISVVILTYNSEATIGDTVAAAMRISDDIHVVDSFSSDQTSVIAEKLGSKVVTHTFVNYAAQRNWAIEHLPLKHEWELHLDADERMSEQLVEEVSSLKQCGAPPETNGYCVPRLVCFLGRPIRHGGMFPIWHMRLFRRGKGRCEDREYDQHFIVDGLTGRLRGAIIDDIRIPLSEWVSRHNRWSDAEVRELLRVPKTRGQTLEPRLFGNPLARKRYLKNAYSRLPPFTRAFLLFAYRYIFRLGFLDGKEGAIFFFLQALWFRFLIDAKLFEQQRLVRPGTSEGESIGRSSRSSLVRRKAFGKALSRADEG